MIGRETSNARNLDSFRQYNKAQGDNFSNSNPKNVYEDPKVNSSLNSIYPIILAADITLLMKIIPHKQIDIFTKIIT